MIKEMIDVNFDFTTDSPRYWDGFWERKSISFICRTA